jgi:hypothetical protein
LLRASQEDLMRPDASPSLSSWRGPNEDEARRREQLRFAAHARRCLSPGAPSDALPDARVARELDAFLASECAAVSARARTAPTTPREFRAWFESLEQNGPGQHDPLFDHLASRATLDEMRWFLAQERAGEAGFDDLVALTQVKMPTRPKLELARNYWDEMGGGHANGMHGPMLETLARELSLDDVAGTTVWESLALGNLLAGLALDRRYAFHSIGALGVVELTAPGRCEKVLSGMTRLGIGSAARRYYALHAVIDLTHSRHWNDEVLEPLLEERPAVGRFIAEGALARLSAGARVFDRYRRELGLTSARSGAAASA